MKRASNRPRTPAAKQQWFRTIGFGPYDWIQASAITTLLRLAARGVDRTRTIADVRREFPHFRLEAQLYVVQDLLIIIEQEPALAGVIAELSDLDAWKAAEEDVTSSEAPDPGVVGT